MADLEAGSSGKHFEQARAWFAIADACLENACGLVADAELLLEHGRPPRALALAVLATEELGKGLAALGVISSGGDPAMVAEYARSHRRHTAKLETAGAWAVTQDSSQPLDESLPGRVHQVTDEASDRKMAGLYVDASNGQVVTPARIGAPEAGRQVALARMQCDSAAAKIEQIRDEDNLQTLWQYGPVLLAALHRTMAAADDPGRFLESVRTLALTIDDVDQDELRRLLQPGDFAPESHL